MTRRTADTAGLSVGLSGASTLLGQEILRVLEDRGFPIAHLARFEAEAEEPDLPVLDLSAQGRVDMNTPGEEAGDLDVLFLAARPRSKGGEADLLGKALAAASMTDKPPAQTPCLVVDCSNMLDEIPGRRLSIPSCDELLPVPSEARLAAVFTSPHPATVGLSRILLPLASQYPVKNCVAQIFLPASELGPKGIEELQKQTVSLLSFQKFPQKVFGDQMAFNMLARLPGKHANEVLKLESAIRREVRECFSGRLPAPALCFFHAAVFYSLAFSIFIELEEKPGRDALTSLLSGEGITIRKPSESGPSPVEAAGSGKILLDTIASDPDRPGGYWIWAAVDNIRLAAENAVEIASRFFPTRQPKQ